MTTLACVAARRLPGATQQGVIRRHMDACLRCQVESARDRRLQRELRGLRTVTEPAPQGLLAAVMTALDIEPAPSPRRTGVARRVATGSALLAAAVGAVGAAVVAVRRGHVVS